MSLILFASSRLTAIVRKIW